MVKDNRVYHVRGTLGISFARAVQNNKLAQGPQDIIGTLKKAKVDCDGSLQHDESYYIEIKTVSLLDGLPLTADFIQKVKESGGRFAGNPMARFLNLKVTAPQPA